MLKRIFIFIMIFTIIFNFISYDNDNAYASTGTFGDIYGTELGSQMLAFVLASLSVGVTYSSLAEVEQLFKTSELIDWDAILGSAPDPPPGGGHNPNKKLIAALLLGVPGGAFLSSIFGDLITWFQDKGATEGENVIIDMPSGIEIIDNYVVTTSTGEHSDPLRVKVIVKVNGVDVWFMAPYKTDLSKAWVKITEIRSSPPNYAYLIGTYNGTGTGTDSSINYLFSIENIPKILPEDLPQGTPFNYNVKPSSPVITDIPPTTLPQPDISMLPGIETITTPQGYEKLIYPGDFEDLANDIVNNTTFEDISNLTPGSNPYSVTETEQGLNINIGIEESPYPDIESGPIEDTAIFQGENISLIKSIINWLSLIRNDISSLPDKLFQVPPDLSLNFDNLKLNGFQDRFPFSIPWDIAAAIGVFSSSPSEPDLTIDMDTNYFTLNHEIDISAISLPLRFARYAASVFFVLYLANKTRDLIKW